MFAQLIAQLKVEAVMDTRDAYKAIKKENAIEIKSTGKGLA